MQRPEDRTASTSDFPKPPARGSAAPAVLVSMMKWLRLLLVRVQQTREPGGQALAGRQRRRARQDLRMERRAGAKAHLRPAARHPAPRSIEPSGIPARGFPARKGYETSVLEAREPPLRALPERRAGPAPALDQRRANSGLLRPSGAGHHERKSDDWLPLHRERRLRQPHLACAQPV